MNLFDKAVAWIRGSTTPEQRGARKALTYQALYGSPQRLEAALKSSARSTSFLAQSEAAAKSLDVLERRLLACGWVQEGDELVLRDGDGKESARIAR